MIKKFLQKIFKKVSYGIFLMLYGKIDDSINCDKDSRIKVDKINIGNELSYNIYNIDGGRLYTDRIHDTAVLIENKIIKEPSFQLRYNGPFIYNANIKENIVNKKGTPRKLKKINGTVLSLLTGGAGNENYWHWLFDVLPKLYICNKIINLDSIDHFLVPDHAKKFQIETLNHLNIFKNKILSSEKFRHIKTNKLIVIDHPVNVSENPTKDIMNMPIWISRWLKDKFLNKINKNNDKKVKKIYIDREDNTSNKPLQRSISNESEVKSYLFKNNFTSVKLHELKFLDQVQLFYDAECIVGLHGGGFANIVFSKEKTKVIELKGIHSGNPIENLAKKNNLRYDSISVETKENYPNQQGQIHIPIDNLNKILEKN